MSSRIFISDPMGELILFKAIPIHDTQTREQQSVSPPIRPMFRDEMALGFPVPITALSGTRSVDDPSFRPRDKALEVYTQETWVWRKTSHNGTTENIGQVYFLEFASPEFSRSYRAYVRARGVKAARIAFVSYLSWNIAEIRDVLQNMRDAPNWMQPQEYPPLPNAMAGNFWVQQIKDHLHHFLVPENLQEMLHQVAVFLADNAMITRDPTTSSARQVIELRLDRSFENDALGFEYRYEYSRRTAWGRQEREELENSLARAARDSSRLIPTLIGDDCIGVVFHQAREAAEAIASWIKAIRSGVNLVDMRRKLRSGLR